MRLSTILELLLIFLLIAFAAYGRVIERDARGITHRKKTSSIVNAPAVSFKQAAAAADDVNKYCVCSENICNCCREFHIPLVKLSGPGCASLQYLNDDKLAMQLSIGDNILSSSVVNGKSPKPVCVALPGGFSKFCGKLYSIKRESDKQHFKACLGLELRSSTELEASLRVSCFRFGPEGLKLRPAEPLPPVVTEASTASDDDYEDFFGLDDDDDEDDDADDDYEKVSPESNVVPDTPDEQQETEEDDEDDFLGFGALLDIFTGDDEGSGNKKKKPATSTPLPPSFVIPILALTSTPATIGGLSASSKRPITTFTQFSTEPSIAASSTRPFTSPINDDQKNSSVAEEASYDTTDDTIEITTYSDIVNDKMDEDDSTATNIDAGLAETTTVASRIVDNKIPENVKVKKATSQIKKKVTAAAAAAAATQKPLDNKVQQSASANDDSEDDYDYGLQADDDDDDDSEEVEESVEETNNDKDDEKEESNKKADSPNAESQNDDDDDEDDDDEEEEEDDDDDDEEEEEDAVLGALVSDGEDDEKDEKEVKKTKKKVEKNTTNKVTAEKETEDYDDDLAALLTRNLHPIRPKSNKEQPIKSARRSKDMRF